MKRVELPIVLYLIDHSNELIFIGFHDVSPCFCLGGQGTARIGDG